MANPSARVNERLKFFGVDGNKDHDQYSMPEVSTGGGDCPETRPLTAPQYNRTKVEDIFVSERERLNRNRLNNDPGWRFSCASSVSSIYHSAQDITDLMSDNNSEFSDPLPSSPHRSYHSVNMSFENDREDIFSSTQASPIANKKKVNFQEPMALTEVDFVLVWDNTSSSETGSDQGSIDIAKEKRKVFERNLESEGLQLQREKLEASNLTFLKIHASMEVLRRYADILKLRMPMKELDGEIVETICTEYDQEYRSLFQIQDRQNSESPTTAHHSSSTPICSEVSSVFTMLNDYFEVDPKLFPPKDQRFSAVYNKDKEYLFDMSDEFFTPLIKARIVDFILRRTSYSDNPRDDFAFGIERLLKDGVYYAAYPLHDGDLKTPGSQRHLLLTQWASLNKGLKYQPLDPVKEYFGVKIGLYFAWLGFYTHTLIPASIIGFICFLYGCLTLHDDQQSKDICNKNLSKDIFMCPNCDLLCDYWKLEDTCFYARLTYLFDNSATVGFAVFMSLWSACFLEYWKRYAAEIKHRWDLSSFDIYEEHPRPEYLARLKHIRRHEINVVTNKPEPHVPFWKMKLPHTMFSLSMVLFLITLAIAAVVAVVVYRLSFMFFVAKTPSIHSWGLILVNVTAASINLVFIFFFNWLYSFVAEYLTEIELHRTQSAFDDSLTLKMYLLQFVNYYSSIFYIAFFKGRFVGSPSKYTTVFGFRQEECQPGGCLTELCIQLAIIMVGKQAMNTILEMMWPIGMKWWTQFKILTGMEEGETKNKAAIFSTQWAKDVKLLGNGAFIVLYYKWILSSQFVQISLDWGPRSLFPEYLEMVLQYGFVTIFVAAFPLAPLFALLNNILEMRLDAKKLLTYYRRPVSQRVKDIGVWYGILEAVGKLAVISNAFIIAFTSNFIPKLVYMYSESGDGTLEGFLEHSLATFNTSDFSEDHRPMVTKYTNVTVCRYQQYRSDHLQPEGQKYKRTAFYWKVWMARLAFVVVFENVVALAVILLKWMIPDVPRKLQDQIRKETYLTNEIIIDQEKRRARGSGGDCRHDGFAQLVEDTIGAGSNSLNKNIRKRHKNEPNNSESAEAEVMV